MRKIITATFVSLDGVMQAPGGPEEDPTGGFRFGGWIAPHWEDEIGAVLSEGFSKPFDLLLGRKTYDIFAAHWPFIDIDPKSSTFDQVNSQVAETFNRATKFVATRSNKELTWQNSQSLGQNVVAALHKLKKGNGPDLLVQGSADFIQTLLANDLIDEMQLFIFPLLLGNGKRLFAQGTVPAALKVAKSTVTPGGVVIATYKRSDAVETGSFAMENPTEAELERRRTLQ
jgi:dihydrofolate reductase